MIILVAYWCHFAMAFFVWATSLPTTRGMCVEYLEYLLQEVPHTFKSRGDANAYVYVCTPPISLSTYTLSHLHYPTFWELPTLIKYQPGRRFKRRKLIICCKSDGSWIRLPTPQNWKYRRPNWSNIKRLENLLFKLKDRTDCWGVTRVLHFMQRQSTLLNVGKEYLCDTVSWISLPGR